MPDSPAPQPNTGPALTFTDDHLTNLHKSVTADLKKAGANVPFEAIKPIHVPDEKPKNIIDQGKVDTEKSVPTSFNSTPETALSPLKTLSEHFDYADQLVTGRTHVMDEAHRFTNFKKEKEDKRMEFANAPKTDTRTSVKKLVDWLHK